MYVEFANEYVEFYKAGLLCCFQYVFKNSSSFNSAVHHVPIKPVIFSFKVEPDQKSNGDSCGYEGNAEKKYITRILWVIFYLIIAYYICIYLNISFNNLWIDRKLK